jgi:hypothetical protein
VVAALWCYLTVAVMMLSLAITHIGVLPILVGGVVMLPIAFWLLHISEPPSRS